MLKWVAFAVVFAGLLGPFGDAFAAGRAQAQQAVPQPASVSPHMMTRDDIDARREALFQSMLADPANLDVAFEYAKLSIFVRDYDAAIATLERMLIFAPALAQLRLELGILYYRIEAYDMATAYLRQAVAGPGVPADVRARVERYLDQIALLANPPTISGYLFTALRWQSNANSAPGSQNVTLNGLTFLLDEESTGASDGSIVTAGGVHFQREIKNGKGDRIEADVVFYSARYFDQTQVNLEFVEGRVGPNFNLNRFNMEKTRLSFYVIGNWAQLEDDTYFGSGGGGMRLFNYADERATLDMRTETRIRQYNDTRDRPTSSFRDGPQSIVSVAYSYLLRPRVTLFAHGHVQRESAERSFFSNWEVARSAGVAVSMPNPINKEKGRDWVLQLGGGVIDRKFDMPDPSIDPVNAEKDDIYWARGALTIPIKEKYALIPQVEYRDQDSNYDIYKFHNLTVQIGLQRSFSK